MASGAENAVAAVGCEAAVAVLAAGDEVAAAAESLAGVAGVAGTAGLAGVAGMSGVAGIIGLADAGPAGFARVALFRSFCAPPLLLIVTPGATSAVDDVEPVGVDVVPDVAVVDVGVVPVVPVEVGRLGAGLVPCVEVVADSVELASDDVDELLDDDEDEDDGETSAAATPWPVATAVSSHAETASPPWRPARAAVRALREIGWCDGTCWRVFRRRSAREAKTAGPSACDRVDRATYIIGRPLAIRCDRQHDEARM